MERSFFVECNGNKCMIDWRFCINARLSCGLRNY